MLKAEKQFLRFQFPKQWDIKHNYVLLKKNTKKTNKRESLKTVKNCWNESVIIKLYKTSAQCLLTKQRPNIWTCVFLNLISAFTLISHNINSREVTLIIFLQCGCKPLSLHCCKTKQTEQDVPKQAWFNNPKDSNILLPGTTGHPQRSTVHDLTGQSRFVVRLGRWFYCCGCTSSGISVMQ